MSLVKTKRDLPAAPPDVENGFRTRESRLRGRSDDDFASRWIDVAGLDAAAQQWILRGLDLLLENIDGAGPGFDGARACSLLVDQAVRRRHEPGDTGFEYEILTVSGWLEAALPASLARPRPGPFFPAVGRFDPDRLTRELLPLLARRLIEVRDAAAEPDGFDDLDLIGQAAGEIEALVRADPSMWAMARADGPLHEGWVFADNVLPSALRPTGDFDRLDHLRRQVHLLGRDPAAGGMLDGYDDAVHREELDTLLKGWLAGSPELDDLVAELIEVSPSHQSGLRSPVYVPATIARAPDLRRTLAHEFLHRLAHPHYLARAAETADPQILVEGVADVLTADLLPEVADIGYGSSGAAAVELYETVGPDRLKAAYFLGRTEFIGLS
ncbi:hypothetical protein [Herbidospora yilanensis]|uniref:hypothetical protein n=1 Tax=Herbidospora yilanensis TaxID=354426 RepID=UPI000781F22F|nr:hypothetical protein [Herbidospora yilanensis]